MKILLLLNTLFTTLNSCVYIAYYFFHLYDLRMLGIATSLLITVRKFARAIEVIDESAYPLKIHFQMTMSMSMSLSAHKRETSIMLTC